LNRATGNRVRRQFVDSDTGKPVDREEQVKGYEVGSGEYIMLDPEEVASAVPDSDKTLSVSTFIGCGDIDDVYFDKPYYLAPTDRHAEEAYGLIREGMRKKKVAALAQTVLFRRVRTVLIRAHGTGLIATTLNFDYEVRSAKDAFDSVPDMKIKGEMLELAEHIIKTKRGKFNPKEFDDHYEAALAEVVKAKIEGRKIEVRKAPRQEKVVDLMAALRESAGLSGKKTATRATAKKATATKAKAAPARRKAS
ncbi:MAG TPA: Ku protein, partial [Pararhizobium sp.]|uniref:non-homologous end joining protein Ku n=1 Tax=Pararhizobium sp. TaxID=1977563 RepID=UPI002BD0E6AC